MDNCDCNDGYIYYHHTQGGGGEALIILGIVHCIQKAYYNYKMKKNIKKYLKIIVEFSNIIQDEKNILQDMKNANFTQQDINEQYNYVVRLILKQRMAMREFRLVEEQYPGEINNRFFYFKDKSIF